MDGTGEEAKEADVERMKSAVQTWPIGRAEAKGAEGFGRVSQEGGRFLRASRNGCFFLLGLLRSRWREGCLGGRL